MKKEDFVHKLAIVYTVGSNYIEAFKVSIHTFVMHNIFAGDIIIFYDKDRTKQLISKFVAKYKYNFIFKKINTSRYTRFKFNGARRRWAFNPAYRFEIFLLHDYDRVLYLDCDTLITANILSVFTLKGDFCACRMSKKLEIQHNIRKGFNGGVLLISKKFLNNNVYNELLNFCERHFPLSGNQIVLNCLFENHVTYIPQYYNITTDILTEPLLKKGKIFHFIGDYKPWKNTFTSSFNSYVLENTSRALLIKLYLKYKKVEKELKALEKSNLYAKYTYES